MVDEVKDQNVAEEVAEKVETPEETTEKTREHDLLEQLEAWKKHARDWEEKAKNNKDVLDKTQLETAVKEETISDLAEKVKQMEDSLLAAQKVAMVNGIAAEYGVSKDDADLFLTGNDEETLRKQAAALAGRDAGSKHAVIPSISGRSTKTSSDDDLISKLFNI